MLAFRHEAHAAAGSKTPLQLGNSPPGHSGSLGSRKRLLYRIAQALCIGAAGSGGAVPGRPFRDGGDQWLDSCPSYVPVYPAQETLGFQSAKRPAELCRQAQT